MRTRARFRLSRRYTGIFFIEDNETARQESLRTRNPAIRQWPGVSRAARSEAHAQPAINLQIARAYLNAADPHEGDQGPRVQRSVPLFHSQSPTPGDRGPITSSGP